MEKILKWLSNYGVALIVVLLIINTMQNCSQSKSITKNRKAIIENSLRIDSISGVTPDEFAIMAEIQKLQTAKLILYDWNTVVRTTVRPDDRMNEYDNQIAKLTKELSAIKDNKMIKK